MEFFLQIPQTLPEFLLWLIIDSTAAVFLTAVVVSTLQKWWHRELSDLEKRVVAIATPIVLIVIAYSLGYISGAWPFSVDTLYQYIASAIAAVLGGQGIFHFVWNPVGKKLEAGRG